MGQRQSSNKDIERVSDFHLGKALHQIFPVGENKISVILAQKYNKASLSTLVKEKIFKELKAWAVHVPVLSDMKETDIHYFQQEICRSFLAWVTNVPQVYKEPPVCVWLHQAEPVGKGDCADKTDQEIADRIYASLATYELDDHFPFILAKILPA